MSSTPPITVEQRGALRGLLAGYSLEMNAKDIDALELAAPTIPAGTQVSITYIPNEDFAMRVAAASSVRRLGFTPMPHISARRVQSERDLEAFLEALAQVAQIDRAFVVAGDPQRPEGPYVDALAAIKTGLLGKYGVKHVGIAGYPEGHPDIGGDKLWRALHDKQAVLDDLGHTFSILTQFGFDADPVLGWLARLRREGIDAPVCVGVAGPTSVKALIRFAARCGVATSAKVMAKYGVSITKLLGSAGPDPVVEALAAGLVPSVHGEVGLHLYPFGGFAKTAGWAPAFAAKHGFRLQKPANAEDCRVAAVGPRASSRDRSPRRTVAAG